MMSAILTVKIIPMAVVTFYLELLVSFGFCFLKFFFNFYCHLKGKYTFAMIRLHDDSTGVSALEIELFCMYQSSFNPDVLSQAGQMSRDKYLLCEPMPSTP